MFVLLDASMDLGVMTAFASRGHTKLVEKLLFTHWLKWRSGAETSWAIRA